MGGGLALGPAFFIGPGAADAAGAVFVLQQRIIAAAGARKLSIFFYQDLDGNPGKSQCNERYGEKHYGHK